MDKNNTPNASAGKPSEEYLKQYIKMRTVLDSIESMSLYFSLSAASEAEKIKRFKKIERILKPAIKEITELSMPKPKKSSKMMALSTEGNDCPRGFCNCNGVCVPYDCPG